MSTYSKAQEDRMERKMLAAGFVLVEDTARRKKHAGDRIMEHHATGVSLCIDHKSTTGKQQIALKRDDLEKINTEAGDDSVPVITFSYKSNPRMYAIFRIDDLDEIVGY